MNTDLAVRIDAFPRLRVAVLGDAMLDSYLEGTTGRVCREAPVPHVTIARRTDVPGGSANTAVNVHALGGQVKYLTVLGDDSEGGYLRSALRERDVSAEHVLTQPGRRTPAKHRIVAASQILLRFDQGDAKPVSREVEQALIARLADLYPRCDAVIVSDYDAGVVTPRVIQALADLQARWPRVLVVDSRHRLAAFRDAGVTAVKPNYEEAAELLGSGRFEGLSRADGMALLGERILELTGARVAAVTLDHEGALLFERGRPPYRTYAPPARKACVAGAGDTFVAALTLALAAGTSTHAVGELASAAAAVVVAKEGTAVCSAPELREYIAPGGKYVPDVERLAARLAGHRQQGKRIVFTNGCFDILHRGHVTYLSRAKSLGDVLVVGVNADASIRRLKGPARPINTLEDRIQVLAALSCIDYLIGFDDDTSCNLIRALRPDVFVKGGDYTRESLPEAPLVEALGGSVQFLPYLSDRSTTALIERIQEASRPAADGRPRREPAEAGRG